MWSRHKGKELKVASPNGEATIMNKKSKTYADILDKSAICPHPAKAILQDCWENSKTNFRSFVRIGNIKAESIGFCNIQLILWLFVMPSINLNKQQQLGKNSEQILSGRTEQNYTEQHNVGMLVFITDGSKDPETGCMGAAVFIPQCEVATEKRTSDHHRYMQSLLSSGWQKITSGSWAALTSIKSVKSYCKILYLKFTI